MWNTLRTQKTAGLKRLKRAWFSTIGRGANELSREEKAAAEDEEEDEEEEEEEEEEEDEDEETEEDEQTDDETDDSDSDEKGKRKRNPLIQKCRQCASKKRKLDHVAKLLKKILKVECLAGEATFMHQQCFISCVCCV